MITCFALFALTYSTSAQTPKSFKGIITYSMSYSGGDAATIAQQPKISTTYVMDNKKKSCVSVGEASLSSITDGDKKEVIILFEQPGFKGYFKMDKAEIDADMTDKGTIEIKYLDETRTIAGYSCKKALCINKKTDGKSDTTVVFYTEDLGGDATNFGDNQLNGLKGFPLEIVSTEHGIKVTVTATEIKKGKVKDTDFLIPADFTELTGEMRTQLKTMITGGGE
jgi:hypothetical protein